MDNLQNELISFSVIALVVVMLAFLTKKMEDRDKSDN